MTSSNQTYDVFVRHDPGDVYTAAEFGRRLYAAGLRSWLDIWSAVPGAPAGSETEFAVSASRLVANFLGPSGLEKWVAETSSRSPTATRAPRSVAVLGPGCPLCPSDVPTEVATDGIADFRKGFGSKLAWGTLAEDLAAAAVDPARSLHPESLHRKTIVSYDEIAEKFAELWFHHPPMIALEKLVALLPANALVLDAGCGPGHHSKYLSERGHYVVGVDLSEGMLRIARRRVRSVPFQRMDVRALTFPCATFDAVWCAAMAMHVPREEFVSLLQGFHHVLRPTGLLGINMQIGRRSEVVKLGKDLRFFEYYRDGHEIAELLEKTGFEVVARDYGETTRNTHELDVTLKWVTLYARLAARPPVGPGPNQRGDC